MEISEWKSIVIKILRTNKFSEDIDGLKKYLKKYFPRYNSELKNMTDFESAFTYFKKS